MPSLSRILLVDDEEDLLFLLQTKLRREGYHVDICLNGNGIIEKVKTEPPDLILLDIKMLGVDGGELCQLIKSDPALQYIKVVLFSANHDIEEIAANRLADGWLSKPYDKGKAGELFAQLFFGIYCQAPEKRKGKYIYSKAQLIDDCQMNETPVFPVAVLPTWVTPVRSRLSQYPMTTQHFLFPG